MDKETMLRRIIIAQSVTIAALTVIIVCLAL